MFRRGMATCCLVATTLGAGVARAEIVSAFEQFCMQTDGRIEAVQDFAGKLGWRIASPEIMDGFPEEGFDIVGFEKTSATTGELVVSMLSDEISDQGGALVRASMCTVMSTDAPVDAEARLTTLMQTRGVSPEGHPTWAYSHVGSSYQGEPTIFDGEQAVIAIARERPLFVVTLKRSVDSATGTNIAVVTAVGMFPPDPVLDRGVPVRP